MVVTLEHENKVGVLPIKRGRGRPPRVVEVPNNKPELAYVDSSEQIFQAHWSTLQEGRIARGALATRMYSPTWIRVPAEIKQEVVSILEASKHIGGHVLLPSKYPRVGIDVFRKQIDRGILAYQDINQGLQDYATHRFKKGIGENGTQLREIIAESTRKTIIVFQGSRESEIREALMNEISLTGAVGIPEIPLVKQQAKSAVEKATGLDQYENFLWQCVNKMEGALAACGFDRNDVYHAAYMAGLEVLERFDPSRGIRFVTYARSRIIGSLIDIARRQGTQQRHDARDRQIVDEYITQFGSKNGRLPTRNEISDDTKLTVGRIGEIENYITLVPLEAGTRGENDEEASLHEVLPDLSMQFQPEDISLSNEKRWQVQQAVSKLPERYQLIINMYYVQGLTLKQIGKVLGVSETRVCQLHKISLVKLKNLIGAIE